MTHCHQVWLLVTSFRVQGAGPGLSILHEFTLFFLLAIIMPKEQGTWMASGGWTELPKSHEASLWSTRLLGPGVNVGAAGLNPLCSCMRSPGPGRL